MNRRVFERKSVALEIEPTGQLPGKLYRIRDVSRGGFKLETDQLMAVGDHFDFSFNLPGGKHNLRFCGKAVWTNKISSAPGIYQIGFAFQIPLDKLPPELFSVPLTDSMDENEKCEPNIPPWEKIFPIIASQDRLLRALLTPIADAAAYYQTLIKEAEAAGLQDYRLLLSMLWHAPLGTARHDIKRLPWLQELITEKRHAEVSENLQIQRQWEYLLHKFSKMLTDIKREWHAGLQKSLKHVYSTPDAALQLLSAKNSWLKSPENHASGAASDKDHGSISAKAVQMENSSLHFVHSTVYPQGGIPVNQNKYEALIYELGRLNTLQKYNFQIIREAKLLKAKMESQRQEEINHLRQMILEKKLFRKW
jgi:PilZ domain